MIVIKHWLVTGDTHGRVMERLSQIKYSSDETAVIILGDAGLNFYLNKTDWKNKYNVNNTGYKIYCVRGNHEERPENLGMKQLWDAYVKGVIYYEPEFPNIHYFIDGEEYLINGLKTLVIGGAYSIDKWWRLARAGYLPEEAETANPKKCGWFKDEQLTEEERNNILKNITGKTYDLVLTHTCPVDWEPTDLFLGGIDQSKVDRSMELWLQEVKETIYWGVWCFAHYHASRLERPFVEQYFTKIEDLDNIIKRWGNYRETFNLDYSLDKSPNFYQR